MGGRTIFHFVACLSGPFEKGLVWSSIRSLGAERETSWVPLEAAVCWGLFLLPLFNLFQRKPTLSPTRKLTPLHLIFFFFRAIVLFVDQKGWDYVPLFSFCPTPSINFPKTKTNSWGFFPPFFPPDKPKKKKKTHTRPLFSPPEIFFHCGKNPWVFLFSPTLQNCKRSMLWVFRFPPFFLHDVSPVQELLVWLLGLPLNPTHFFLLVALKKEKFFNLFDLSLFPPIRTFTTPPIPSRAVLSGCLMNPPFPRYCTYPLAASSTNPSTPLLFFNRGGQRPPPPNKNRTFH